MRTPTSIPAEPNEGDAMKLEVEKRAIKACSEKQKESSSDYNKTLEEIFVQQRKSEQDLRHQIVTARKYLLGYLVIFMTLETMGLFAIVIWTSLPAGALKIQDTTLQILVGATIAQISTMLVVIVRSVYSDSLNRVVAGDTIRPSRGE